MFIFLHIIRLALLVVILFSTQAAIAETEDDYLKELEQEAANKIDYEPAAAGAEASDSAPSVSNLDAPSTDVELIQDKKELISDITSFEKALKESYKESYGLYQELSAEQKDLIYQDFKKNKRLYNSSVKVISTYLSSH